MRIYRWLGAIGLMAGAFATWAQSNLPPQVAISPPRVEVEMNKGTAQASVRLFNMGEEPIDVDVSVADWFLDENNRMQASAPDDDSLAKTLLMNPSRFTLPAGESQAVRFAVRPRSKPRDGEHRMMLFLNERVDQAATGNRFVFEFQVPVYVLSGEIERVGEFYGIDAKFSQGALHLGFDVASDGNASVRLEGTFVVRRLDDNAPRLRKASFAAEASNGVVVEGSLPYMPVFAGTRRMLRSRTEIPLEPGRYRVEASGKLSGVDVSASGEFTVP